jgi:hypothetical protein
VARLALMVLRLVVAFNLVTGILFWTGNADPLQDVHIVLGIIAVLDLWALAIFQGLRSRSFGLVLAAFVVGLPLWIVGAAQTEWLLGSAHWIIQVIHLMLGMALLGVGERIGSSARRIAAKAAA